MLPVLQRLALSLAVILCAVLYGYAHFYRDPGSIFFDPQRAFEQRYSKYRRAEVEDFVNSRADVGAGAGEVKSEDTNPSLCVALSSVKREHSQYLETTIGSLLQGLSPQERADLHISILVAETDPKRHPAWHSQWLNQSIEDLHTYNTSSHSLAHLHDLEQTHAYAQKGVIDYVHALERCHATKAPYVGIFEDDIMLAAGWMVRTLIGLRQTPLDSSRWLYMRLFNQERSTGWASRKIGGNNEHWIILGIGLGIALPAAILRRKSAVVRKHLDLGTIYVVVFVLVPALVLLAFQSGKASLFPPFPGVVEEPFGCCSQAMIFPRAQIPALVSFLQRRKEGQVDLLLNDWADEAGLERHALYPVQAQHIGLDSSRMTMKDEAQAIWSMAFEDLDPEELERTHREMVEGYYDNVR